MKCNITCCICLCWNHFSRNVRFSLPSAAFRRFFQSILEKWAGKKTKISLYPKTTPKTNQFDIFCNKTENMSASALLDNWETSACVHVYQAFPYENHQKIETFHCILTQNSCFETYFSKSKLQNYIMRSMENTILSSFSLNSSIFSPRNKWLQFFLNLETLY